MIELLQFTASIIAAKLLWETWMRTTVTFSKQIHSDEGMIKLKEDERGFRNYDYNRSTQDAYGVFVSYKTVDSWLSKGITLYKGKKKYVYDPSEYEPYEHPF